MGIKLITNYLLLLTIIILHPIQLAKLKLQQKLNPEKATIFFFFLKERFRSLLTEVPRSLLTMKKMKKRSISRNKGKRRASEFLSLLNIKEAKGFGFFLGLLFFFSI